MSFIFIKSHHFKKVLVTLYDFSLTRNAIFLRADPY